MPLCTYIFIVYVTWTNDDVNFVDDYILMRFFMCIAQRAMSCKLLISFTFVCVCVQKYVLWWRTFNTVNTIRQRSSINIISCMSFYESSTCFNRCVHPQNRRQFFISPTSHLSINKTPICTSMHTHTTTSGMSQVNLWSNTVSISTHTCPFFMLLVPRINNSYRLASNANRTPFVMDFLVCVCVWGYTKKNVEKNTKKNGQQ